MVALIRERTTDIVNATSHLIYYMEGENDNGAHDFVKTMMDICSELRNNTNDYETFPMMKMGCRLQITGHLKVRCRALLTAAYFNLKVFIL